MSSVITEDVIQKAFTYDQFRSDVEKLLEAGMTTGENHSEDLIEYTRLNLHRMKRVEKQAKLTDELKSAVDAIERPQIWICLVEGWCGDVPHNLPAMKKVAEYSNNVDLKLLLRDENLEVMDQYLTNGGRSIPKMIALDRETLEDLWTWGPRPAECQKHMKELKQQDLPYEEITEQIQKWYAKDKTRSIQQEFAELVMHGEFVNS